MKIIDLLNKIANGEEVPKKIRINGYIYEYQGDDYLFIDKNNDNHEYWLFSDGYTDKYEWLENFLRAEIEIIEEEKKIPEKLEEFGLIQYNLDYIDYKNIETLKEWLNKDFQTIYDTLDLIIKNQNKLIDYLKSKGE